MSKSNIKKGSVIERRRNHTVNQDVAASFPKWFDVGCGMLESRSASGSINHIRRNKDTNKWESVKKVVISST